MHARVVLLGEGKVSCLERCPQFRSVLIERERFHSITVCVYNLTVTRLWLQTEVSWSSHSHSFPNQTSGDSAGPAGGRGQVGGDWAGLGVGGERDWIWLFRETTLSPPQTSPVLPAK